MARGAVQKYGAWNAAFLDADPSFVRERVQDQDIADSAVFENIGYATLDEGANPGKPYLFIAGFEEETFDALPTTLIWGRLPANDSEVLISARLLTDAGVSYHVGDSFRLSRKPRKRRIRTDSGRPVQLRRRNFRPPAGKDLHRCRRLPDSGI